MVQRAANPASRGTPQAILMSANRRGAELQRRTESSCWSHAGTPVEMQAVMRAHRIGEAVIATRFHLIPSRSDDAVAGKETPRVRRCMDGNQAALAQFTEEDLQFLFKR